MGGLRLGHLCLRCVYHKRYGLDSVRAIRQGRAEQICLQRQQGGVGGAGLFYVYISGRWKWLCSLYVQMLGNRLLFAWRIATPTEPRGKRDCDLLSGSGSLVAGFLSLSEVFL